MAATVESAFVLIDRASGPIRGIRRELRELQADAQKAGRDLDSLSGPKIQQQMEAEAKATRQASQDTKGLSQSTDKASQSTRRFEQRLKSAATQASRTRSEVDKLDKTIGKIAKWGSIAAGVGVLTQGVVTLGGAAVALLPKITELAGAGAAWGNVMVGAGASLGVVKLATHGLSSALQGNKKALAALTPDARAFVQELKNMQPELKTLQTSAQGGLFGGMDTLLADAKRVAPQLNAIVSQTSGKLGGLASWAGGQITQPGFMRDFSTLIDQGTTAFGQAARGAFMFGEGLEQVLIAAGPLTDWLGKLTDREAKLFDEHMKLDRENGKLAKMFDRTKSAVKTFGDIGVNVFDGLKGVMKAARGESDQLWGGIDRDAKRFDAWANGLSGQNSMKKFFGSLRPELHAIGMAVGSVFKLLSDLGGGQSGLTATAHAFTFLASGLDKVVKALGPMGKMLGGIAVSTYAMHRVGLLKPMLKSLGIGEGAGGGKSSPLATAAGKIEGSSSVYGSRGIMAKSGSLVNPIAVLVVDKGGTPVTPGKAGKATTAAEDAASTVEKEAGATGVAGVVSRAKGLLSSVGEHAMRGGTIALGGTVAAQLARPALESAGVSKKAASTISKVATDTALGAGAGAAVPVVGPAAGAIGGTIYGLLAHVGAIPKASITAGAASGVATSAADQLYRGAPPQGQSAVQAHSYAQTAQGLQAIAKQAQGLSGGLNALPVGQLEVLQKDAQKLAGDPALKAYAGRLLAVGQSAHDALVGKAGAAFQQMQSMAGKSLGQIKSATSTTTGQIQTTLGKGSAAARDALAQNFLLAAQDVAKSMQAGVTSTQQGMTAINTFLSRELKALGVNIGPQLAGVLGVGGVQALAKRAQTGGSGGASDRGGGYGATNATGGRLPGPAIGDHIPLTGRNGSALGIADGGELIINRHTERDADSILGLFGTRLSRMVANETRPHARAFATGGRLGGGSHWDRLLSAANLVSRKDFPYHWGGGHEQPAQLQPFDCSGAVSYAVQHAGYKVPTTVAGSIGSWGFPTGPGQATIFYNGVHTFMRIGNRYWGTSGFARPGGGAGWFDQKPDAGYLSGFSEVHLPDLGSDAGSGFGAASIRQPKWRGPGGALGAIGRGVLRAATRAANQKLANTLPAGSAGGGDPLLDGGLSGPVPRKVQEFMRAAGFNRVAIAGMLGNAMQESSMNPQTPGGGLWQQISNFGAGTGGSLLNQMETMLPQIEGLKAAMNAARTPSEAAQIFEQGFEKAGIVAMANRMRYANQAYSQGYRFGGRTPAWGGWNARGADVTVNRPTVFGAGENGPERVRITPHGSASHVIQIARGAVQVNAAGGDPKAIERYVDRRLQEFAEQVADEIENGAAQDPDQVMV